MGLIDNSSSKPGFFGSIFSSKSKETAPTTQEKTKTVSALREFVKAPITPRFNLLGRAKEITPTQTEAIRPQINKTAIQKQAEHINAVKTSKMWANENVSKPLGTSANEVHALKSPGVDRPTAFFKVGSQNESASGTMEEFMWKTANILGDAKQFVATSQTTVNMKSNDPAASEKRRGGIQTAENSVTLAKYIDYPPGWSLSKSNLLKASLTSMVMGMGDAHAENILINKDTHEIVYFDNTRSLPPTNGYLDRGFGLVSSYRSGLMELSESYIPLEKADIDQLKQQLAEYKAKINDFKSFMNSPQTIQNLSTLPPGWMNREKTIIAMEERIERLEKALNSNDSINLRDLAMAMSPQYKVAAAFEIAGKMIESKKLVLLEKDVKRTFDSGLKEMTATELADLCLKHNIDKQSLKELYDHPQTTYDRSATLKFIETLKKTTPPPNYATMSFLRAQDIQRNYLGSVGYNTMNKLFETCALAGIDPQKIKDLCDDPFKSFDEIVMDLGALMETDLVDIDEASSRPELLKSLYSESDIDLKDIERETAIYDTLEYITENLEMAEILDNCEIVNDTPPVIYLRYAYNNQDQVHTLDYLTVPGKLIVQFGGKELPPMTASELKEWMESRTLPKGSEGFMQLIAKFSELKIPIRALNPIDAIREARKLENGEYFIAQERGASTPKLKVYLLNDKGQIESYDLKFNSKLELTVKLGTLEKNLSPEKLKELLTKPSK